MSTVKTKVNQKSVARFLQEKIDPNIASIEFLKGGEISQAFSFTSKGEEFVIRLNHEKYSFEKDEYAYKHFSSQKIPIPKITKIGKFNESLFFAISEKAKGKTLDTFSIDVQKKLIPHLISIHDAFRKVKLSQDGFGHWGKNGNAKYKSWRESLAHNSNDHFEKLYKDTFLEKSIVEEVHSKINSFLPMLPEERYLVHGDFAGNNAVSDGEKITGILDWGESLYGDPLYDIAWGDFYFEELELGSAVKKHYQDLKISTSSFDERILCYQLKIGVGGLGFFALSQQKENYDWQKGKLLRLLSI